MKQKNISALVIWHLAVSTFIALVALSLLYPLHPITLTGGIIWFASAVPLILLLESIGSATFSNKIAKLINKDTTKVSSGRIVYGVLVVLIIAALATFINTAMDTEFNSFFGNHFSKEKWYVY